MKQGSGKREILCLSGPPLFRRTHTQSRSFLVKFFWETPPEINAEACLLDDSIDNEDEPFYCVYLGMKELEKMRATKAWGHQIHSGIRGTLWKGDLAGLLNDLFGEEVSGGHRHSAII